MEEATTTAMGSLLSTVGSVFTSAMSWAGTVGTTIVDNPILLIGVVLAFVGVGVGLFRRMLNV